MSKLNVYDMKGASVGDYEVADGLLVLNKGEQAVHEVVLALLAGRRAGTASTKCKGEVAGSNKKPWRQKGTGRARAGYRQSPVWRGGGTAFGPKPRSYAKKVNRKVAHVAFQRAWSDRVAEGAVKVVDGLSLPEAKTRLFAALLKALGVKGPALVVVESVDPVLSLAARNVPRVEIVCARDVNVYQLTRYPVVVASRGAMEAMRVRLEGKTEVSA